ncbi:MAG: lipase/acyltransferase domain-containing protein [Gaiellaceae bacterium]
MLNGRNSGAYAINNRGQIVGGGLWSIVFYPLSFAWRYEAGALTALSGLGGQFSVAYDVNAAGTAVGEARLANGLSHAFRSTGHLAAVDLGTLPGELTSIATGINAGNDVVGRGSAGGWLHSGGVMTRLTTLAGNPAGWQLLDPVGISDDGLIAGNGRLDGESRAFVLSRSARVPLIFIPGITGSVLERGPTELWPRVNDLIRFPQDTWLLDLRLEANGVDEWDAAAPVRATDILRAVDPPGPFGTKHVYDRTVERLVDEGYVEGRSLLVFPFDWRKSVRINAQRLLAFMRANRACAACKFDVLAHSQGGLVTMQALEDPDGAGLIRRVVTVGTPVLGSVKALGALEYRMPCFVPSWGACLLDPETLQTTARNLPGLYELLPSPAFHQAAGSPLKLVSGFQAYAAWSGLVASRRNPALVASARDVHERLDDFTPPAGVAMIRVVGSGKQTYDYIQEKQRYVLECGPPQPPPVPSSCVRVPQRYFEFGYGNGGDGTVLVNSADLRRCNGTTAVFDRRNGVPNRYFPLEHLALVQDERVLRFAVSFFESGVRPPLLPCGGAARLTAFAVAAEDTGSDEPGRASGVQLEVVGPTAGGLSSFAGERLGTFGPTGPDPAGVLVEEIPDGRLEVAPADPATAAVQTHLYALDDPGVYYADLVVTSAEPVRLRIRRYASGSLESVQTFDLRDLPAGARLGLAFSSDGAAAEVAVDRDADGSTDERVPAIARTSGEATADDEPPTVEADGWTDAGTGTLVLHGSDSGGSGVAGIRYRLDAGAFGEYSDPIEAAPAATVAFFGIDGAGNLGDELVGTIASLVSDDAPDHDWAARPLADGSFVRRLIDSAGDEDWFRFDAPAARSWRVQLVGLTADFDVRLYDGNGRLVGAGTQRGKRSESVEESLEPGRYLIRVSGFEGAADPVHRYGLRLDAR